MSIQLTNSQGYEQMIIFKLHCPLLLLLQSEQYSIWKGRMKAKLADNGHSKAYRPHIVQPVASFRKGCARFNWHLGPEVHLNTRKIFCICSSWSVYCWNLTLGCKTVIVECFVEILNKLGSLSIVTVYSGLLLYSHRAFIHSEGENTCWYKRLKCLKL